MSSYKEIIGDEVFRCRCYVSKERFRKKSFSEQHEELGLIHAFVIPTNHYLGSMPLWWDDETLNKIMVIGEKEIYVHRITVSTFKPMIHFWTYEDYRKGCCGLDDIDKPELLPSGNPKEYRCIQFLVREMNDNETNRWDSKYSDIEDAFRSVWKWCYRSVI